MNTFDRKTKADRADESAERALMAELQTLHTDGKVHTNTGVREIARRLLTALRAAEQPAGTCKVCGGKTVLCSHCEGTGFEPSYPEQPAPAGAEAMNNPKRLFDLNDRNDDRARELTKGLIERGKLIEAGFALYVMQALKSDVRNVSPHVLRDVRNAFMAGAEHVYSSIMTTLDPGEEPTEADMERLDLIDAEVEAIRADLWDKVHTAKGRS